MGPHNWWSRLELLEECLLVPGQRQSATPGRGPGIWSLSRSQLLKTLAAIYHKPTIWGWFIKFIPPLYGDFGDDLSLGLPWFTHFSQGHFDPTGAGFTRDSWQDLQSSLECCGGTRVAWQGRLAGWRLTFCIFQSCEIPSNPFESHVISGKRLQFAIGNGHRKFVDLLKIVIFHGHVSLPGNIWSSRPQLIPIQGMKWNGSDVKRRPGCESRSFAIWVAGHLVVLPLTPNGNPQWKHMETMDIPSTPNGNHGLALVLFIFKFLNGEVFKRDGRIPAGRCDDKFGPCCFAVVRLREVDAVGRWLASILRVFSQGLVMKEKNGWEQLRVLFNVLVRIQFDRQVLVTQLLANSGDVDKISSVDPMIFSDKHP